MFRRRHFMAGLGSAALAVPSSALSAPSGGRIAIADSYVANIADQDDPHNATLSPGQVLSLRREPERAFDTNSIAVMCGQQRLGYLPGDQSRLLAPMIDAGFTLGAVLVESREYPRPSLSLNLFVGPS